MTIAPLLALALVQSTTVADDGWRFDMDVGKGFVLEHGDEFRLATRLRGMFLYTLDGGDAHGFQIRRARVAFTGHVFTHAQYKMEIALSPRDVSTGDNGPRTSPLLDLYFRFTFLRDLNIQVGQYKVPFSRQRVISSGNLALVDRTIVNGEFNLDRDLGVELRSKDLFGLGWLRYYAGVYIGEGRNTFRLQDLGIMTIFRLEFLPLGLFKDYTEAGLKRPAQPKLSIGVAHAFIDNAKGERGILGSAPEDGGTTDTHNVTADVVFLWRGISFHGSFHLRDGRRNPPDGATSVDAPRDGYGFSVQPSYLVPWFDLEISGRFSMIRPTTDASALARRREAGGGVSYYFVSHSMKLQADYFSLWTDGAGTDNIFRFQLQAAF